MKLITDRDGRRRVWYGAAEIERICEDRLRVGGLWPTEGSCEVDVEALVEVELGARVDYTASLSAAILGYTVFDDPVRIVVNRSLTMAAGSERAPLGIVGRWRATLAHEAAHILLHSRLYLPAKEAAGRPPAIPIRCSRTTIDESPGRADWREVQANMGMAAILMPKAIFDREARQAFAGHGLLVPPIPRTAPVVDEVSAQLSARFRVSRQAAGIRLATCGYTE